MADFISLMDSFVCASKEVSHPLGSIIVKGSKCNMSCDYCFVEACTNEDKETKINEDAISSVLSTVENDPTGYITVWAGEPLYNKEIFIKVCELINKKLPKVRIGINTNGILLNDWWADFMISHNVYVHLSHDGPGQKYRGVDFFNNDECVKALQKLSKAGRFKSIMTVVHKRNCDFNKIMQFFKKAREEKLIIPEDHRFILVGPRTEDNKIVYDFDPMDADLIKFIQDNVKYIINAALNNEPFYRGTLQPTWGIIKNVYQKDRYLNEGCNEYLNTEFSISSTGEHCCPRGFFNREHNKKIIKNHIAECTKCEVKYACPLRTCVAINLDKQLCLSMKNRLETITKAFDKVLNIWNSYELNQ